VAYTYDQLNRLSSAQTYNAATWGNSYGYDAWGNLLSKTLIKGTAENMSLTVNSKNQVTFPAFTYDAAGDVTYDTSVHMTYDAEGRMNPTSGTTYIYDGDGRRVQKSDGTVYWVDDELRPLSVGTSTGSITRDYIFLGQKRIAFVPLSSGNPYYYLGDHLGSTAVVASGDGKTVQWEADYFPFGSQRTVITNLASNPYEFTGYEYDSATGYNYAVARFEAGRWGRFLSPDPYSGSMDVSNPQSLNRYSYVNNDPSNSVDPFGLWCSAEYGLGDSPCNPANDPQMQPGGAGYSSPTFNWFAALNPGGASNVFGSFFGDPFGDLGDAIHDFLRQFVVIDTCPAGSFECPSDGVPLFGAPKCDPIFCMMDNSGPGQQNDPGQDARILELARGVTQRAGAMEHPCFWATLTAGSAVAGGLGAAAASSSEIAAEAPNLVHRAGTWIYQRASRMVAGVLSTGFRAFDSTCQSLNP
jgi:RHS repeat-associated protein